MTTVEWEMKRLKADVQRLDAENRIFRKEVETLQKEIERLKGNQPVHISIADGGGK